MKSPIQSLDELICHLSKGWDLGLKITTFKTITGHDALAIQKRNPASLIFVPSEGDLSHNPREFTERVALDKGYAVLVETLWRIVTAQD